MENKSTKKNRRGSLGLMLVIGGILIMKRAASTGLWQASLNPDDPGSTAWASQAGGLMIIVGVFVLINAVLAHFRE